MKNIYQRITGVFLIVSFLSVKVSGQTTSTYIYLNPVFAFTGLSSTLDQNSQTVQGITYTRGVYGSFGTGFSLQAGIGKMINNYFGFEIAGEWLNGKKIHSSLSSDSDSLSGDLSQHIESFMIKPMLILRNSGDLLTFYSKLGIAISVYSKGYSNSSIVYYIGGQSQQVTTSELIAMKPKVGFVAAFGVSARVSQSIAITLEASGQMIALPEKSGHYNQFLLNGVDQLPMLKTNAKSWTYEKSISTAPGDPNKPGTQLYDPQNFSYIGISLGIRYYL